MLHSFNFQNIFSFFYILLFERTLIKVLYIDFLTEFLRNWHGTEFVLNFCMLIYFIINLKTLINQHCKGDAQIVVVYIKIVR